MKVIRKSWIITRKDEAQVMIEKDIAKDVNSPYVVSVFTG